MIRTRLISHRCIVLACQLQQQSDGGGWHHQCRQHHLQHHQDRRHITARRARHPRLSWNEYEFYAQDSWKATRNLNFIYGLRYSYLQVPAETSGTQVGLCQIVNNACAPGKFSLTKFVNQSAQLAASGQAANGAGQLGFPISGRYNGKPDYWTRKKQTSARGSRLPTLPLPIPASGKNLRHRKKQYPRRVFARLRSLRRCHREQL